jgi:hypothetical protein
MRCDAIKWAAGLAVAAAVETPVVFFYSENN